jgi:hypothetical protein
VHAAFCDGLVEQVAERAREHERNPKERGAQDTGPQPKQIHDDEPGTEDCRAVPPILMIQKPP